MWAACLIISFAEFAMATRIICQTGCLDVEEFLTKAPMDKVMQVSFKLRTAIIMLQMATILTVMR